MGYVFYGAALQGAQDRALRASHHAELIDYIKFLGFEVATEHTRGKTRKESAEYLENSIGPLPPPGVERTRYVRDKMIEAVEGDAVALVFEVSQPSLGTGIEFAHAYLRPRMGLSACPVLALYQRGFWKNKLSTMIAGIDPAKTPPITQKQYADLGEAKKTIKNFLKRI
ncbi:MAG: hypothetical protein GF334_03930 [Candidatus Altiarchaeales archaeon]|nr:hypothetical protein [Candidatus Altiarchaeales archaeon]